MNNPGDPEMDPRDIFYIVHNNREEMDPGTGRTPDTLVYYSEI